MKRIAIVGGGIAGLAAAYELARLAQKGAPVEAVLFESSNRFGGVIETVREGGFTVECGPDAWVSAKPWARELAIELGMESELIASNDAARRTYIFLSTPQNPPGSLVPMPDGFNMMVPTNLDALAHSTLFSPQAIAAYRGEPARAAKLRAAAPAHDESVADFILRHFGPEVLDRVAAPLLSGVFGGDVNTLSVCAVMPAFVAMEREHGSLIAALQAKLLQTATANLQPGAVFTTLRSGLGTLIDRLVSAIPPHWLRLQTAVTAIHADSQPASVHRKVSEHRAWTVRSVQSSATGKHHAAESFDAIFLATPLPATRRLLAPLNPAASQLLPTESSSAVLVAFAYSDASRVPLPPGFGFLVPPAPTQFPHRRSGAHPSLSKRHSEPILAQNPPRSFSSAAAQTPDSETWVHTPQSLLLACTFTDQKFPHRVPPGGRLIRAFFGGGTAADRIARCNNDEIAAIARLELARILHANAPVSGPAPSPAPPPALTVIRRWPNSLPQYAVGHPARAAELESRLHTELPGLALLGNALHGVGIPDLIRQSRRAARAAAVHQ